MPLPRLQIVLLFVPSLHDELVGRLVAARSVAQGGLAPRSLRRRHPDGRAALRPRRADGRQATSPRRAPAGGGPGACFAPPCPSFTFLWSTSPTWPTVAMHSLSTCRISPGRELQERVAALLGHDLGGGPLRCARSVRPGRPSTPRCGPACRSVSTAAGARCPDESRHAPRIRFVSPTFSPTGARM